MNSDRKNNRINKFIEADDIFKVLLVIVTI